MMGRWDWEAAGFLAEKRARALSEAWGSSFSVRPTYEQMHAADDPKVTYACPVCERVGFDCGGHDASS